MNIKDAIVHHLAKEQHTSGPESVVLHVREDLLPMDETLNSVCTQTLALFNRRGNNTGTFGQNEDVHRFPIRVQQYLDGEVVFEDFSAHAVEIIQSEMSKASAASGGHAFFVRYESGGEEFLLVAMLKLREGAGIDEASLGLLPTLVIDTDKLHEAARLNITRWKSGDQPYLTFIKGRGADTVTAYFREALACEGYTSGRHHTKQIISAAEAYVLSLESLTVEDRKERWTVVRERLFECFSQNKSEVGLAAIAVAVEPLEPQEFEAFVTTSDQASQFQVSHHFKPDREAYRGLKRVRAKMGTVTVAFDIDDVRQGRVAFDASANALLIYGPSEDVKKEITDNVSPGA